MRQRHEHNPRSNVPLDKAEQLDATPVHRLHLNRSTRQQLRTDATPAGRGVYNQEAQAPMHRRVLDFDRDDTDNSDNSDDTGAVRVLAPATYDVTSASAKAVLPKLTLDPVPQWTGAPKGSLPTMTRAAYYRANNTVNCESAGVALRRITLEEIVYAVREKLHDRGAYTDDALATQLKKHKELLTFQSTVFGIFSFLINTLKTTLERGGRGFWETAVHGLLYWPAPVTYEPLISIAGNRRSSSTPLVIGPSEWSIAMETPTEQNVISRLAYFEVVQATSEVFLDVTDVIDTGPENNLPDPSITEDAALAGWALHSAAADKLPGRYDASAKAVVIARTRRMGEPDAAAVSDTAILKNLGGLHVPTIKVHETVIMPFMAHARVSFNEEHCLVAQDARLATRRPRQDCTRRQEHGRRMGQRRARRTRHEPHFQDSGVQ